MAASNKAIRKIIVRVTLIFFSVATIASSYYFVYIYGPELSGRLVRELVKRQSDQQYEVDFLLLDISILRKRLEITDLDLMPIESGNSKRIYQLHIPKIEISLKSLWEVYWNRTLTFEQIVIIDPQILITKTELDQTQTTLSIESGDLYKLIEENLYKLEIDSLGIKNASLTYQTLTDEDFKILLKELDFGISKFSLDSTTQTDKFLNTDNITLRLTNQHFLLEDSIHQLDIQSLDISTQSQNILFKNIELSPREGAAITSSNSYRLSIPALNFRGLNFQKAYTENHLQLDSVRMQSPKIRLLHRTSTQRKADVVPSLFKLFNIIEVGKLFIEDGTVDFSESADGSDFVFQSQGINVEIQDFFVDSSYLQNPTQQIFFQDFLVNAEEVGIRNRDSSRHITVQQILASSMDSLLEISQFQFVALNETQSQSTIHVDIPKSRILGFDFRKAWLEHSFSGRVVSLDQPALIGQLDQQAGKNGASLLQSISLDQIRINEGKFDVSRKEENIKINSLTAVVNNISAALDSNSVLRFRDDWNNADIEINDLLLSGANGALEVSSINVTPDFAETRIYDLAQIKNSNRPIEIDTLIINGLKKDSLIHTGFIIFDSLTAHGPHFLIDLDQESSISKDRVNDIIHKVFFQKVRVDRGKVNVVKNQRVISHMDSISTVLSSFHYDTIINEYFTGIDFHADTIHISFNDIHHGLSGNNISISQRDSTLDINNLALLPYSLDSNYNHYKVISSELKLRQLNFHRLINDQEIAFSSGFLKHPNVEITIATPKDTSSRKEAKDLISFESFNIGSGNLSFSNNLTGFTLESRDFDVLIHDFDMLNDSNLFFANNYLFDAKQTSVGIRKLDDNIRIGHSQIDTKTGNLLLQNLSYKHSNILDLSIPKMQIKGLVTNHLLDHGQFTMDSLALDQPSIKFGVIAQQSKASNPPNIAIKNFSLKDGKINLHKEELNHGDSLEFHGLNLTINEFIYDSLIRVEFSHHLFQSLDLSGSNLSYTLPDSLFRVRLGHYTYDHTDKHVELKDLRLIPLFNRGEFQTKINFQKDWLDGSIASIYLHDFDIDSIINNQLLLISKVEIDQFNLDTHRDKRLPRPPNQEKPLPASLLQMAPIRLKVDTLLVRNGFVNHSEYSETGELPGTIYFQKIDASLTNITNDPSQLTIDPNMVFKATGVLMETGDFNLTSTFDLTSTVDAYSLSGRVGDMNLTELSKFLENTAFVQVRSGTSQMVDFMFDANDQYALGEMTFYYDDLKINVLNQESYNTKSFGASLKTFFANTFVVNTKNPHFIFVRDGSIFHERDQSKSIFNYWGKALLSGVVSSIGAKNNKKEIKQQNEEIRQKYDALKKNR